jgi:hypothetical protein
MIFFRFLYPSDQQSGSRLGIPDCHVIVNGDDYDDDDNNNNNNNFIKYN